MRFLLMLLLCLPLIGKAQLTAEQFIRRTLDKEANYQSNLKDEFVQFSKEYGIPATEANYMKFADIYLTHELFTANSTENGSSLTGDMPYMWHYIEPNPRKQIRKGIKFIEDMPRKPYESFATADRTPDIFLTDFFSDTKYYHPLIGSFSTFGWCSEREMAYSSVMQSLGYNTYIHAPGAHSTSHVTVYFNNNRTTVAYTAIVDNTYNSIRWTTFIPTVGYSNQLEQWYNKQADAYNGILKEIYISPRRATEISKQYDIFRR